MGIPREGEAQFVFNTVKYATKGIVLTWAVLGQVGNHHVNCQSSEYVHCMMNMFGWQGDMTLQDRLVSAAKKDTNVPWIQKSLNIFVPKPASQIAGPSLLPLPEYCDEDFTKLYFHLTEAHCNPARKTQCR